MIRACTYVLHLRTHRIIVLENFFFRGDESRENVLYCRINQTARDTCLLFVCKTFSFLFFRAGRPMVQSGHSWGGQILMFSDNVLRIVSLEQIDN